MAINATIQVRRGLLKDFDPTKMLPGEWAVSVDTSTSNQIVWMCFAPGVCKRMGTYEDFQNMVYNATGQIIERYEDAFGSILEEVNTNAEAVSANTDIVLVAKSDIINTYLPQIKSYVSNASASASEAKTYSENAKASASEADKSAEDAKKYSQNAFSTTPEGYEALVGDVDVLKNSIIQTTDRTLYGSKEGGIKLIGIGGASEQCENPSPDNPQEIESVGDLKNLLEVTATSQTVKGVTFTVNEDKSITVNGTPTENAIFVLNSGMTFKADEEYAYTNGAFGGGNSVFASQILRFDGVNQDGSYSDIGSGTSFKGVEGRTYTARIVVYSGVTINNVTLYPMIRKASVQNAEYKPYGYSLGIKASNQDGTISKSITIPLNEPLREGDEIAVVDGVWDINRNVVSEVFDGSEDGWVMLATNHGDGNLFYIPLENLGVMDTSMSTQSLLQKNVAVLDMLLNHHRNTSENFYIVASFSTLDDWKAHLAENPITVQYELATPVFEPFTDQTPFYGLESFDTVTYISTDSEVEPSIELKFAKTEGDAVTLLNYNQTNLNRIAIAELTSAVLALNQE